MTHVVGIDGCPGGWVAACLAGGTVTWRTAPVEGIGDLLPRGGVAGIDMPIGLLDHGRRECDALARRELPGAASRVFTTPPRAVLEAGPGAPNADVQSLCRELMGVGVSRQALHLADRILALDTALAERSDTIAIEVHPELAFRELAGEVLPSKHGADGIAQRRACLAGWRPDIESVLATRPRIPLVDALDALAALWSAVRWRDGRARTLPADATAPPFIAI